MCIRDSVKDNATRRYFHAGNWMAFGDKSSGDDVGIEERVLDRHS